jgi:N-acetylmuramoyl-L-alanine amidase CwlA
MITKHDYLPLGSKRRSGRPIKPIKYIVAHDTGNDGSTAQGNVNYYKQSANAEPASAHAFVDDGMLIWCIPETEKAWHVHYDAGQAPNVAPNFANDCALGIEGCFGVTKWPLARNLKAYQNYVTVIADLCRKYRLDPRKDVVAHGDLDPTRRADPAKALGKIGKSWAIFLDDLSAKVTGTAPRPAPLPPKPKHTFAVRPYLKLGSRNAEVVALQDILKFEKMFPADQTSTGYYGQVTKKGVLLFQKKYLKTDNDGVQVGPQTIAKLNSLYGK